jgi:hypothetical protein
MAREYSKRMKANSFHEESMAKKKSGHRQVAVPGGQATPPASVRRWPARIIIMEFCSAQCETRIRRA